LNYLLVYLHDKRAGLSSNQLHQYYTSVIRSGVEYCDPVWHYAVTKKKQTQQLETIQKKATRSYCS